VKKRDSPIVIEKTGPSEKDATMLMRKRLNTEFVKAKWINKNTLEYWPCSAVNATKIQAPNGKCFRKIPVNISINTEGEE